MLLKLLNKTQLICCITILCISVSLNSPSQSTCQNLDFEDGTLGNWTAYTGDMFSIDSIAVQGAVYGRHTITHGTSVDPNTNFQVYTVAPDSYYSCKLGNDIGGSQAERLEYTYRVSDSSALFIYQYAVVFEDPGHSTHEQPQFEVTVLDSTGNCIDSICGYYQVSAAGNIPGFSSNGLIRYKDWTTVGMNLTYYIGQKVTISFTSKDCGLGGHFGYAYIDASYRPMELKVKACAGSDSITMSAPYGFAEYLWMPGNISTREFNIPAAQAGDEYTCILTSVTGCQISLTASTEITQIEPEFEIESCEETQFTDLSTIENDVISEWNWCFDEPDGSRLLTDQDPIYFFREPGIYNISLTIISRNGCQASVSKSVKIYSKPKTNFIFDEVCYGDPTNFTNNTIVDFSDTIVYLWDFGNGHTSNEIHPVYTFPDPDNNYVKLKAEINQNCYTTIKKEVPTKYCQVHIPNILTPNNDSKNDFLYIENINSFPNNKLMVFNRWGVVIYEQEHYQNNWTPKNINPGVYYYIFSYETDLLRGGTKTNTGFLNIFAGKN